MNAMAQVAQRMTADEYLAMDFEEQRTELVEGELIVMDMPLPLHQYVLQELTYALEVWARAAAGRGRVTLPLDVKIDERNVYGPDLLWYAEGRAPVIHAGRPSPLPDIAVEVRSPATWRYDVGAKKAAYERVGLKELWLVDTAASIVLVYRRASAKSESFDVSLELAAGDSLTSPLLPAFALAIGELFAPQA